MGKMPKLKGCQLINSHFQPSYQPSLAALICPEAFLLPDMLPGVVFHKCKSGSGDPAVPDYKFCLLPRV